WAWCAPPETSPVRPPSEPIDGRHDDDGRPGLVRGGEIDRRRDAPVVVAHRVIEDLAHYPRRVARSDEDEFWSACVRCDTDVIVLGEVGVERVRPRVGAERRIQFR